MASGEKGRNGCAIACPFWLCQNGTHEPHRNVGGNLGRSPRTRFSQRKDWQAVISGPLAEWEKDPRRLDDDGIVGPSRETLQRVADLARELCALGLAAPQRVAATGDGGVVLARQEGAFFSNIEVMGDGSAELTVYRDSRLVSRQRLF
jgi:hypothetical protein